VGADFRELIVAENASGRFGGEAALPLHYYRELRARGSETWLLTHARTRGELSEAFPGDSNIVYVEDSAWHRFLWRLGRYFPASGFSGMSTTGSRISQRFLVSSDNGLSSIDV
jgi:hypothetical protein